MKIRLTRGRAAEWESLSSKCPPLIPLKSIVHYSWMTWASKEIDAPLSLAPLWKYTELMELNAIWFRAFSPSLPLPFWLWPFFHCCNLTRNYLYVGLFCLAQIAFGNQVTLGGGRLDHTIPSFCSPDQQMSNSSTVLWYHPNQPAVAWMLPSLLMRDKLHDHSCARVWMYSHWPCFMWIERINAVFLFVFSCMVLFSMQPYHKSLVTEMGAVLVLSLKFVL